MCFFINVYKYDENKKKGFIMIACVKTNGSTINFFYLILANKTSVSRKKDERNAVNGLNYYTLFV